LSERDTEQNRNWPEECVEFVGREDLDRLIFQDECGLTTKVENTTDADIFLTCLDAVCAQSIITATGC
jgi:hypothetical protein